jgi:hypothetical protein
MYAVIFIAATVELAWYEVTRRGAIRRIGQQSARAMGLCSDGLGTALAVISAVVVGICGARPHFMSSTIPFNSGSEEAAAMIAVGVRVSSWQCRRRITITKSQQRTKR